MRMQAFLCAMLFAVLGMILSVAAKFHQAESVSQFEALPDPAPHVRRHLHRPDTEVGQLYTPDAARGADGGQVQGLDQDRAEPMVERTTPWSSSIPSTAMFTINLSAWEPQPNPIDSTFITTYTRTDALTTESARLMYTSTGRLNTYTTTVESSTKDDRSTNPPLRSNRRNAFRYSDKTKLQDRHEGTVTSRLPYQSTKVTTTETPTSTYRPWPGLPGRSNCHTWNGCSSAPAKATGEATG